MPPGKRTLLEPYKPEVIYLRFKRDRWYKFSPSASTLKEPPIEQGSSETVSVQYSHSGQNATADMPTSNNGGEATALLDNEDPGESITHVAGFLKNAKHIVHEGDPMPDSMMKALLGNNRRAYVRRSKRSPNLSSAELNGAIELGSQSLSRGSLVAFNALPQNGGIASLAELITMSLE